MGVVVGITITVIYRWVTVLGASAPRSVDLLVKLAYYGLVLVGVVIFLISTYADSWGSWDRAKKLRMIVFGLALYLLSLSSADIVTVWTVGMLPNQTLTGSNFFLAEGIDFREFVTEVGGGALLAVAGLVLDLAERGPV